ncbi:MULTISPECIES: c-type cytochrome [Rhizobium]|uniref:Cytochrome c family protein n=1 Tax=Rhizobium rhododendri TaxID=2506430 RepID=A0ABY8ICY7_9HYPH|nr:MULTISPECIES: cytochrome c family protein [Rhizobium]MBZ5758732.1 cytochrome c family protein [Rhizobium sp. VS19-DR96]MBZ5764438.1 cytochrome c family protein [Rhizobium sp. VS19-DR129.2]MBZ5771981.1 cytochrome c family protein [Rhizobium sp. VS19-DRK62.2]MBZ5783332.1 cytochrome c family protein [Rhizobium sp. VS19-DR121]MBZ5800780.1 cytochrome c family protein [Rhizobium sp. VS19-DR181]
MKTSCCSTIIVAALLSATSVLADGDPKLGAGVFKKCAACHTATEPVNKVGPSLMGVVGRPVASVATYSYSAAMKTFSADGKVWDEALLHKYLLSPQAVVKGTRMSFAGVKSDSDVDNLIAYLKNPAAAQ